MAAQEEGTGIIDVQVVLTGDDLETYAEDEATRILRISLIAIVPVALVYALFDHPWGFFVAVICAVLSCAADSAFAISLMYLAARWGEGRIQPAIVDPFRFVVNQIGIHAGPHEFKWKEVRRVRESPSAYCFQVDGFGILLVPACSLTSAQRATLDRITAEKGKRTSQSRA